VCRSHGQRATVNLRDRQSQGVGPVDTGHLAAA
jgi:hypothetical protein